MSKDVLRRLSETEAFLMECHQDGPHRGEADCSFYLSVRDVKDAIREIVRLRENADEVERLRARIRELEANHG